MSSVSREDVMQFNRLVLKRIFNARMVDGAIADVAEQMQWPQLEDLPTTTNNGVVGADKNGKGTKRKKAAEGGDGKAKGTHSLSSYSLFMSLAMDLISQDPDNPKFKVPEKLDDAGQPIKGRGGTNQKMTAASGLWSSLSEQEKAAFQHTFKPLIESLNQEVLRTGTKVKDLSVRAKDFKKQLPPAQEQEVTRMFDHAIATNPRVLANAPSTSLIHQQATAAEEPGSTSDDSEEEGPSQQELQRMEQQAQQDKDKKDVKEKKKKEGKEGKGKEKKVKGEEGSAKKKKKASVVSDSE